MAHVRVAFLSGLAPFSIQRTVASSACFTLKYINYKLARRSNIEPQKLPTKSPLALESAD